MAEPGRLRERVTIQTPVIGSTGWQDITWQDVAEVWARVAPLRGREQVEARAQVSKIEYRVTIRHRDDITESHRVLWRGVRLKIEAITNPDEHRMYLELLCEKDAAE